MTVIANFIADVVEQPDDDKHIARVAAELEQLCAKVPAPGLGLPTA
jgi:hypothetical protein